MTFRDKVLAVCAGCGEEWNVPKNIPVPEPYVCPKCEYKAKERRKWREKYVKEEQK